MVLGGAGFGQGRLLLSQHHRLTALAMMTLKSLLLKVLCVCFQICFAYPNTLCFGDFTVTPQLSGKECLCGSGPLLKGLLGL